MSINYGFRIDSRADTTQVISAVKRALTKEEMPNVILVGLGTDLYVKVREQNANLVSKLDGIVGLNDISYATVGPKPLEITFKEWYNRAKTWEKINDRDKTGPVATQSSNGANEGVGRTYQPYELN